LSFVVVISEVSTTTFRFVGNGFTALLLRAR